MQKIYFKPIAPEKFKDLVNYCKSSLHQGYFAFDDSGLGDSDCR